MSCHGCHAEIDCESDPVFPYSLTGSGEFPFVINCPTPQDCLQALTVSMICCGVLQVVNIPAGTIPALRIALIQQLITQCQFLNSGCTNDGPTTPTNPPVPPVPTTDWYFNGKVTGSKVCGDLYGGGTYYFSIAAGSFMSDTYAGANALAVNAANDKVNANAFCANPPLLISCADISTTIDILMVGGHGPFTFDIDSGALPVGTTMAVVGGLLRLTGTPTVTGLASVTLKIFDSVGGYLLKTLDFHVLKITTTSLPDYVPGVPYSQQLTAAGGSGDYAFEIISGFLPNGLSMTTGGLISGTPIGNVSASFTVGVLDNQLGQITPCTKALTLHAGAPASLIIYYVFDGSAPLFHGGGSSSVSAFDLSTVPGGNNFTDDAGGIPRIVSGKFTSGWQGGYYDASGHVESLWNYFPRTNLGLTNKFTMRLWFRIDPFIYNELGGSGLDFIIDTDSVRAAYYTTFSAPGVVDTFYVEAQFFAGSAPFGFTVDSTAILVDSNWHRLIIANDPGAGTGTIQLDDLAPVSVATADILPAGANGRLRFFPDQGGVSDPFPDEPAKFQICEFYLAADYVWSSAEASFDWNGGVGKTWPDVPGVP